MSYFILPKKLVICTVLIALLLIFSLHQRLFFQGLAKKTAVLNATTSIGNKQQSYSYLPLRITIPKIHVDALIEYVNQTSDGAMDVPTNSLDVGWFTLGPLPGEIGTAIIDGHVDSENGTAGVFQKLNQLSTGDIFYIEETTGKSIAFIVEESRTFNSTNSIENFNQSTGSHIVLITCNGIWNTIQKKYTKRLIVFADKL